MRLIDLTTCGGCGADLRTVAPTAERLDADGQVITGLVTCPACLVTYIVQRPARGTVPPQLRLFA